MKEASRPPTAYYDGGVGEYTKMLDIPETYAGKRVLVEFDGSFMNTTVVLLILCSNYLIGNITER